LTHTFASPRLGLQQLFPFFGGDVVIITILLKNLSPQAISLEKVAEDFNFFHPFLSWKDNKNL
jgi:hypothetical protein